ncbi:bifunctional ADP-dependent NAD(P)H-hydrate dehydratase/NAD(P)H-hydrate epimerase [Pedococcus bigeumensis]|uniref:ADP-dependent (S)-NAD(P)H-hydrate dehydratase n=1 Tax=Pedococcus bigeumensis TaxID=433644 RepID=A0A502D2M4_9MICO|nr:bifunctional ADP-dependent NAD(P)H-hydrate dehydratase/NAD(P)H-hydrate epimerase [Pedococcus bigeumensis]TPG19020.1 bifunctional ADP-dependent NAD(P)H-hydrate dehydratase/NAD(P)H-hydrate epimerase [Pedococcus bigeumensis]
MLQAWSAQRVRAAEEALMGELADGELMARAAEGLAEVCRARLTASGGSRVVVLAGPGNNGADALYAAAHLADGGSDCVALQGGWPLAIGDPESWLAAGVRVVAPDGDWVTALADADLVIDGVLGIGGRPGLPDEAVAWVDAIPDSAYVVSVDLPSGQDPAGETPSDTGVFADETVTFGVAKPVHLLPATEPAVGRLTVIDIGLTVQGAPDVERLDFADVARLWPVPTDTDDKYSRGVLGVVAGGEDYSGAAVLCCTAAVGAGLGMLRYVGTPTPTGLVRSAIPEAVHGDGRVQAWVVGPGLDTGSRARGSKAQLDVARAALDSELPVLVDAGGLDLVAGRRAGPTLLTPHAGELARLLTRLEDAETTRPEVAADPLGHARRAADLTGATILLKGATTLVVPPTSAGLAVRSQNDAPPWLATAGAGDVLAGVCGALLAAGLSPLDAGSLGALVHGVAADRANPGGPVRALAVAHGIPETVAHLLVR